MFGNVRRFVGQHRYAVGAEVVGWLVLWFWPGERRLLARLAAVAVAVAFMVWLCWPIYRAARTLVSDVRGWMALTWADKQDGGALAAAAVYRTERRKFQRKCLAAHVDLIPAVRHVRRIYGPEGRSKSPYGLVFQLRVPARYGEAAKWRAHAERVGASYSAVRSYARDGARLDLLWLEVWFKDPFAAKVASKYLEWNPPSIAEPAVLGIDQYAVPFRLPFLDQSTLVVGRPGSGKSGMLQQIVAHAVLCPDVKVAALDFKGLVEFTPWVDVVDWAIGDTAEASAMLDVLHHALKVRTDAIREAKRRKFVPSPQEPAYVVVVDEGPELPEDIQRRVLDLMRRGRFAGFHVVWSTQRSTKDLMDPSLKSMFTQRFVFRTRGSDEDRYARADDSAKHVETKGFPPGRCWALIGTDDWKMGQIAWLEDRDITRVVKRARELGRGPGGGNGGGKPGWKPTAADGGVPPSPPGASWTEYGGAPGAPAYEPRGPQAIALPPARPWDAWEALQGTSARSARAVWTLMAEAGGPCTVKGMARVLELDAKTVRNALMAMRDAGLVTGSGDDGWQITRMVVAA